MSRNRILSTEITPQQLKETILRLWDAWKGPPPFSILVLGPPGVGKSTTIREVAEEIARTLGLQFVDTATLDREEAEKLLLQEDSVFLYTDIRLSYHEPSDLLGVPRSYKSATVFEPPLHIQLHVMHPGIIFFDEITVVQRDDLLSIMLQVALDRKIAYQKLHPMTFIILAGNDVADTALARSLPRSLINRTMILRIRPSSVKEWISYMTAKYSSNWDARIGAFLLRFPEHLHTIKGEEEDNVAFPTPRTWEWVAVQLHKDPNTSPYMIAGLIGEEVASKLVAFLKSQVDVEELLQNPAKWWQLNLDQKVMATVQLTRAVDVVEDFDKAVPLLKTMAEDSLEYVVLIITSLPPERGERQKLVALIRKKMPEIGNKLIELGVRIASMK